MPIYKITIAIVILLAIIADKLWYDLRLWFRREKKGTGTKTVNHSIEWCIMVVLSIPAVYLLAKHSAMQWPLAWLTCGFMAAAFIWILFDGIYNKWRGYSWGFTGSVDNDDAGSDKFLRRFPPWLQQAVKWALLIGAIIIYILNLK